MLALLLSFSLAAAPPPTSEALVGPEWKTALLPTVPLTGAELLSPRVGPMLPLGGDHIALIGPDLAELRPLKLMFDSDPLVELARVDSTLTSVRWRASGLELPKWIAPMSGELHDPEARQSWFSRSDYTYDTALFQMGMMANRIWLYHVAAAGDRVAILLFGRAEVKAAYVSALDGRFVEERVLKGQDGCTAAAPRAWLSSADGARVAMLRKDGTVCVVDSELRVLVRHVLPDLDGVWALALDAEGSLLVARVQPGGVALERRPLVGEPHTTVVPVETSGLRAVELRPDIGGRHFLLLRGVPGKEKARMEKTIRSYRLSLRPILGRIGHGVPKPARLDVLQLDPRDLAVRQHASVNPAFGWNHVGVRWVDDAPLLDLTWHVPTVKFEFETPSPSDSEAEKAAKQRPQRKPTWEHGPIQLVRLRADGTAAWQQILARSFEAPRAGLMIDGAGTHDLVVQGRKVYVSFQDTLKGTSYRSTGQERRLKFVEQRIYLAELSLDGGAAVVHEVVLPPDVPRTFYTLLPGSLSATSWNEVRLLLWGHAARLLNTTATPPAPPKPNKSAGKPSSKKVKR